MVHLPTMLGMYHGGYTPSYTLLGTPLLVHRAQHRCTARAGSDGHAALSRRVAETTVTDGGVTVWRRVSPPHLPVSLLVSYSRIRRLFPRVGREREACCEE